MRLNFNQILNEAVISSGSPIVSSGQPSGILTPQTKNSRFNPQEPNAGLKLIKPMQIPPVGAVAGGKRISDMVIGGIRDASREAGITPEQPMDSAVSQFKGKQLADNIMGGIRDASREMETSPTTPSNFVEITPEEQARVDRENRNRAVFSLPSPTVTPGSTQKLLDKAFAGSGVNQPSKQKYSGPYSDRAPQSNDPRETQPAPAQPTESVPATNPPQKDRGDVQAEMEARAQSWINQDQAKKKKWEEFKKARDERWQREKLAKAELVGIDKDLAGRLSSNDLSSEIRRRERLRNRQDSESLRTGGGSRGGGGSMMESYKFKRNTLLKEVKGFGAGTPGKKKAKVFPNIPIPDFLSYEKLKNAASGLAGEISDKTPEWIKTSMKVAGDLMGVPATLVALPPRELAASTIGRLAGTGFTRQGQQERAEHYFNLMSHINPLSAIDPTKDNKYSHAAQEEMANLLTKALYDPRSQQVRITPKKKEKEQEDASTMVPPSVP